MGLVLLSNAPRKAEGNLSATRGTSPTFQVYAFDLMAKRDYRLMTLAERGLLLTMWCECWANSEIPAEPNELAAMLGKQGEVQGALTSKVIAFFERTKPGTFLSPDLETYREYVLDQRERMSKGGSKGGKKRAEKERLSREASSPPSESNQATLKGRESESESETELAKRGVVPVDDPWVNDYEKASRGA